MYKYDIHVGGKKNAKDYFTGPPCPGCGQPTVPGAGYCYRCDHFIDAGGSRVLKCGEVPDQELEALVMRSELAQQEYQSNPGTIKSHKTLTTAFIGVIAGVALVLLGAKFLGVVLMLVSIIGSVFIIRNVQPQKPPEILESGHYKQMISNYVTPCVLSQTFDQVEVYDPKGYITSEFIRSSGVIYQDYNVISGSQFVRGTYHGVPVDMSNLHLQEKTVDEDNQSHYSEVFRGIILVCDLGTPLQEDVTIAEKRFGLRGKHIVETDHEAFNRKFLVSCLDEAAVFRFLTPHVMEAILQMREMAGGTMNLVAMKDGRVCVAVNSGRSILEPQTTSGPMALQRDQMANDLQYPLSLVDTMNQAHLNR